MDFKGKAMEGNYRRSFQLNREAIQEESRKVELSFSSEEPYERGFGTEILGHEKHEINLKRFQLGGHPLLLQHNPNQQIGVIEKCWVDEDEKVGRAIVRFAAATNKLAEEVWHDVVNRNKQHENRKTHSLPSRDD